MTEKQLLHVKPGPGRSYPVIIEKHSLKQAGQLMKSLKLGRRVAIVSNPQVEALYYEVLEQSIASAGFEVFKIIVPEGEAHKTLSTVSHILDQLLAYKFERNDTVVGLGGGVIGDMAGFAAAVYLRGIQVVHCPTTLLAQSDSAIGGKTGVNHPAGKNLIGAFHQPRATIIDPETIQTLSQRDLACGLAEIVKYGIIRNKALFWYLERHAHTIFNGRQYAAPLDIWQYLIYRSCVNKALVVSRDEREAGLREILNFGHTIGHAIEAVFQYKTYSHGECVAFGMAAATRISELMGLIDTLTRDRIIGLFKKLGFSQTITPVAANDIIERLYADKKVRNGMLRFVLPEAIGQVVVRADVPMAVIEQVVFELGAV